MWTILYFFPVKQKFGDNNKDSEVFVVAPSTAPLNPVLVDRFSGEIKKKFLNKRLYFVPCTRHNTLVFYCLVLLIKSLLLHKNLHYKECTR